MVQEFTGEFGSPGLDLHFNHQVPVILYVVVTVEVLVLFYGRGGQGRKINRMTKYQFLSARWPCQFVTTNMQPHLQIVYNLVLKDQVYL